MPAPVQSDPTTTAEAVARARANHPGDDRKAREFCLLLATAYSNKRQHRTAAMWSSAAFLLRDEG